MAILHPNEAEPVFKAHPITCYLVGLLHRGYKLTLSPFIGQSCRFEPTCSDYALEAIKRYGFFHGLFIALKRLARCHPYCEGGHDPVPTPLSSPKR
jgi:putative membrane protein insertion efficiency factor